MSSSIYVVFYLISCVSTESSLGCSKDRINQVEYKILNKKSATFQMRTSSIIRTEYNTVMVEVDLGNKTILCSKIFDKLRNVRSLSIRATNVVEIETNFLQGKGLDSRLEIHDGKFQTIKKHTFHDLEITFLFLFKTKITTIEEEAFANLSRLKTLNLNGNQLKELNPRIFFALPQLADFRAAENVISKLQKNVFGFLENREATIDLSSNCIEVVDKGAFDRSNATTVTIFLKNNRIEFIPPEICQHDRFVEIDVCNNRISKISPEFFEEDFNITFLNITCNPLDENTLQALFDWRNQSNFSRIWFPCCPGQGSGNTYCHRVFVALTILFISCSLI
jgi:Leucine-rich repeat (LRR) protein